jgi:hypothetical protein
MGWWRREVTRLPALTDSEGAWGGFPEPSIMKGLVFLEKTVVSVEESRGVRVKT